MNKDIILMIELQECWDIVLTQRNITSKNEQLIKRINNSIDLKTKEGFVLEETIKALKIKVNENEVELSETEDHIKKLEIRKNQVKTEKEINAVQNEFEKAKANSEKLEENLIGLYDDIEAKEKALSSLKNELGELKKSSDTEINDLDAKISQSKDLEKENKHKFDEKAQDLSPNIKSKFLKFINSQNGKAIAKIQGEICGACNFQIPFNLIQDLSKEDKIITCTNCGRFIYKV